MFRLTEREVGVVIFRFGLYGKPVLTLEQIGRRYEVSRERIRQIETEAMNKLRRLAHTHMNGNGKHADF